MTDRYIDKRLVSIDDHPILSGFEQTVRNSVFREDDWFDEEGYRHCAKCKGIKEVLVDLEDELSIEAFKAPTACPCIQAERDEINARMAEQERLNRIERVRSIALRTSQLRNSRFENDDGKDPKLAKVCKMYVDRWEEMKANGFGVLIQGNVGTGKTFFAACIANAVIERGSSAYFITAPEIVGVANDFGQYGDDKKAELSAKIKNVDLLVIDDLGAERDTSFGAESIYNAINDRYETGKTTIITTNLSEDQMSSPLNISEERIFDRILEMCPLEFAATGKPRRKGVRADRRSAASDLLLRGDS